MAPDEAAFRADLNKGPFRSGSSRGRWRAVTVEWPFAVFAVAAADGLEYGFRFDVEDYPRTPPTARPWDLGSDVPLATDRWPRGVDRVALAFNPSWKDGTCIYLPCDRQSLEGHANWLHDHPALVWRPDQGIVHYLRTLHDLLNCSDYQGFPR